MRALLVALLLGALARADTAVPREGPIRRDATVDLAARRVRAGEEDLPLAGFLLVEKKDGAFVWAPDFESRIQGYRRMVFEERRPQLVKLAKEAARAHDAATARRLYEWAKREGLQDRDERVLRKRVEKEEGKPRKVNEQRRAAVLRDEKKLGGRLPELLLARARLEMGPDGAGLALLREVLRAAPGHGGASKLLREQVPDDSPFPEPEAWLSWRLDLQPRGFRLAPPGLMELRRAQHHWRPDLYGVEADGMLVITPIRRLDMVAACVLRTRIVLDHLEVLFETSRPKLRTRKPLTVHLFVDRKNFADRAGYDSQADLPPYFRWELGHWDLKEDLTRLLCPETIKDPGNRQLAYTVVHEVVRHWLWSRCPRFSDSEVINAGPVAGYGLAAGFPGFLAEAGFDLRAGTLDAGQRDTNSLRLVASQARENDLIPWRKFFLMTWEDVHRMNNNDPALAGGQRKKGVVLRGHLFMMQGAAVCHFLYNAEGGRRRAALADYLGHHYLGRQDKLNPRAAFGLHPDELGQAVVAWAGG